MPLNNNNDKNNTKYYNNNDDATDLFGVILTAENTKST
jgi:hypothetical protein